MVNHYKKYIGIEKYNLKKLKKKGNSKSLFSPMRKCV